MKSYTRTGDDGTTGRFGGQRMTKASLLTETLGALDETNAAIGLARSLLRSDLPGRSDLDEWLRELQDSLFRVGADLSTPMEQPNPLAPRITPEDTATLEQQIDSLDEKLPELHQFILPGGTEAAATLQLARAITRRAERRFREAVDSGEKLNPALGPYLNRLSSYLFALARYANHLAGHKEEHPRYNL